MFVVDTFNVAFDIYNGTYSHWLLNLSHGQFNVYEIAGGLMGPIIAVWGYWVFLVIWAVYLMMVWIRSGDIGLPLVIGIITAGVWAMLIPTAAYLYIGVMLAVAMASILFKAFTDR